MIGTVLLDLIFPINMIKITKNINVEAKT